MLQSAAGRWLPLRLSPPNGSRPDAPTVGASGRLPFGGLRRSGNHRPAALWSTLYCASPVAVMRGEASLDRGKLAPGVGWADE